MTSKVVLVTGASSGIGEATALKLKALGYTVYAAARRVDRMRFLADAGAHVLAMDVTDDASMQAESRRLLRSPAASMCWSTTPDMAPIGLSRTCHWKRPTHNSTSMCSALPA